MEFFENLRDTFNLVADLFVGVHDEFVGIPFFNIQAMSEALDLVREVDFQILYLLLKHPLESETNL